MGAYGMDTADSTLVPRRNGLNAPSCQAPGTIDTVKTLVSIKVNINNVQLNADHVEMQDDWVNGHRPSQDPWPVTNMLPNYEERILIIRKGRAGISTVSRKLGIEGATR